MNISSNLNIVLSQVQERILNIQSGVLRNVAVSMHPVVRSRIHTDGIAADGSPIGTYSKGYMSVRTGVYKSNESFSKGKKKGETKPTGVFTKGKSKGAERPKYNRTADTKVILSLTGEMEKGLEVMATEKGFGLGYPVEHNLEKAKWTEETYSKKIFALTEEEKNNAVQIAQAYTTQLLNE